MTALILSDIITLLPTNLNSCTRALFVYFDSNCEQNGQLRPPQLVALVQFKFVGSRQLDCSFLRMNNNDNTPLVVKVLGTIVAIPVYACMVVLIIGIPLLFLGSLVSIFSGRAFDSTEFLLGNILVSFILGFVSHEIYKDFKLWIVDLYETYFKK